MTPIFKPPVTEWPPFLFFTFCSHLMTPIFKCSLTHGKSILEVPDTGTWVLDNTRPFLCSSIVNFWVTPARSKARKYHIFRQYTKNVPVFTNRAYWDIPVSGTWSILFPSLNDPPFLEKFIGENGRHPGGTQLWVGYGCAQRRRICYLYLNHSFLEGPFLKPISAFYNVNWDA